MKDFRFKLERIFWIFVHLSLTPLLFIAFRIDRHIINHKEYKKERAIAEKQKIKSRPQYKLGLF
tara:strand:- start:226 stop:417 length:192 start_codon:yes stop_codon:yes gene_type:complete